MDRHLRAAQAMLPGFYEGLMGREIDQGGADYWSPILAQDIANNTSVAYNAFINSGEFKERHARMTLPEVPVIAAFAADLEKAMDDLNARRAFRVKANITAYAELQKREFLEFARKEIEGVLRYLKSNVAKHSNNPQAWKPTLDAVWGKHRAAMLGVGFKADIWP